ncbi:MAG: glycosyltransferase family 9 protein [Crocinitomicaceae bacterium]
MKLNEVKTDCHHFRTTIPCLPNKKEGVTCVDCTHYKPISKRILIIKLGALGDVIRTTPLIVKYKKLYPNAHFTWLTHSPSVLPNDEIQLILKWDATAIFTVANSKYDIAINLDKEAEACLLLKNTDAKEKYGYTWGDYAIEPATPAAEHKLMTGFFDSISIQNTKSYLEEIFEICHFSFEKEPYLINKNQSLVEAWKAKWTVLANGKKIVGMNTGCGPRWNTRLWTNEAWMRLAVQLRDQGYFPVFLGGELEHEKNTLFAKESGAYYPGHFSLEEFIALTDGCEYIVTQVSMMMHIATALQKKMILMNNIFNKHEFELYDRGVIVGPPSACECYFGNTCKRGEHSCMHEITPQAVFEAIEKL